ncbi:thiol-disulfide isomerase and thioredoxin [Actinobacillus equuli]|nr:thiol-disulfide isomerase and thioredoxin [Actinobacillus equuli]
MLFKNLVKWSVGLAISILALTVFASSVQAVENLQKMQKTNRFLKMEKTITLIKANKYRLT